MVDGVELTRRLSIAPGAGRKPFSIVLRVGATGLLSSVRLGVDGQPSGFPIILGVEGLLSSIVLGGDG